MDWDMRWARRNARMKRSAIRELLKLAGRPGVISFAGGLPAPELFPVDAVREAASVVLARGGGVALQYGETEGLGALRDWIAARHSTSARRLGRENVLVTTGSQQGLDLLGRVLLDEGDEVAVENPTYLALLTAWRPYGVRFRGIRMDDEGLDPRELGSLGAAPKVLYTVPNFQNPTGRTMSRARRAAVVTWARERGVIVVEDDPYGELRYSGASERALADEEAAVGGEDWCVVRTGTFSKVLAPGLRVGWVVGPEPLIERLVRAKQAVDLHTGTLDQAIALELVERGWWERQRERLVAAYRERRDAMLGALAERWVAEATWTRPDGGMFVWVTLPTGVDAARLLERAVERGVAFVPGAEFHVGATLTGQDGEGNEADGRNTFRLNFTHAGCREIGIGMDRLSTAYRGFVGAGR